MPANKNHHYVPKFLMRQFSADPSPEPDRSWISSFLIKYKKFIKTVSIAGQCQHPYFHGKSGEIEALMTKIEGRMKSLLGDLSDEVLLALSEDQLLELRHMTFIQVRRTWRAAEETRLMFEAMENTLLARGMRNDSDELRGIQDRKKTPQLTSLKLAFEARGHLEDLAICFLRRSKNEQFILADHPVSVFNQFAEGHPWLGRRYSAAGGIGNKGIQLLLPLSPDVCLAVFDPSTYQYGNGKSRILKVGTQDVRKINMLQAANADSNLYMFSGNPDLNWLSKFAEINSKARVFRRVRVLNGPVVDEGNGKKSQLLGYGIPDIRLGIRLSFVRIINQINYSGYNLGAFPPRSREQLLRGESLRNSLRAQAVDSGSED